MLRTDVLIAGGGICGLSSAFHLKKLEPSLNVLIVDPLDASMSLTSSKSTEAYRSVGWPNKDMRSFVKRSISLLSLFGDEIFMNRNGYAFLFNGDENAEKFLQKNAGEDVATFKGKEVARFFPHLDFGIWKDPVVCLAQTAGWIDSSMLGALMLRKSNAKLLTGVSVVGKKDGRFLLSNGSKVEASVAFVNAAGPMVTDVASNVGQVLFPTNDISVRFEPEHKLVNI